MESLSLATKYRMNSGHEIPALGYGVSIGTINLRIDRYKIEQLTFCSIGLSNVCSKLS